MAFLRVTLGLALLGSSLFLVPVATAQQNPLMVLSDRVDVTASGGHDGRLMPDFGVAEFEFAFDVRLPYLSVCYSQILVAFTIEEAPPWAAVSLSAKDVLVPFNFNEGVPGLVVAPLGDETIVTVKATMVVNRQAPAFHSAELSASAIATPVGGFPACTVSPSEPAKSTGRVIIDYLPGLKAEVLTEDWREGLYLIEVANHANGQTRVGHSFGLLDGGWTTHEIRQTLDSHVDRPKGHTHATLVLTCADVPEAWNGRVRLEGLSVHSQQAETAVIEFELPPAPPCPPGDEATGAPAEVPEDLPGIAWLGAIVALGAATLRRRRD